MSQKMINGMFIKNGIMYFTNEYDDIVHRVGGQNLEQYAAGLAFALEALKTESEYEEPDVNSVISAIKAEYKAVTDAG